MLPSNEDFLEQKLLELGSQELLLEQKIKAIKTHLKASVQAGNLTEADAAWAVYEELRTALNHIQTQITPIERTLYTLRTRKR